MLHVLYASVQHPPCLSSSLLRNHQLQGAQEGSPKKKTVFTNNIPKGGFLLDPTDPVPQPRRPVSIRIRHRAVG